MLGLILVTILLVIVIFKYVYINKNYWKKKNVKQEKRIIWRFITGKQSLSEIYKEVYDAHPDAPYVGIYLGTKPALILRDLKNIQAVLYNDFNSFHSRGFILNASDFLGDNLLLLDDYKRWKLIRQKLSPLFSTKKLKNMFPLAKRCASNFVDYIEENPVVMENPVKAFFTYTIACVSTIIFGIAKETKNAMEMSFTDFAYRSLVSTTKLNFKFALYTVSPKLFKLLNVKLFADYEELFISVMKNQMKKRRNDNGIHHDFIDLCLRLENEGQIKDCISGYKIEVSIKFLAAQALAFILGGIDTTVNAMTLALLELSNNPVLLQKVHAEVDEMFSKNKGDVTFDDIDVQLDYLRKVINEAMRKYPPVGSLQRICCKDTVLPSGLKIEKDTIVIIPTYALHRDEKYFLDPEVFDPERFSAENIFKMAKYSYLPFGEGKRVCIGSKLAIIKIKAGLAWFLRKYTLEKQSYNPKNFEPSIFSLRDTNANFKMIPRDLPHF